MENQEVTLRGSTASLVLGIIGVCTNCVGIGWILGIIAIAQYVRAKKHLKSLAPDEKFSGKGNAVAGLVLGIIATAAGTFWILYIIVFGLAAFTAILGMGGV